MPRKEEDYFEVPEDVEAILHRQDEALALLERLRAEEPPVRTRQQAGGGRRDFRRWPTPPGVTVEMHDGLRWHPAECLDMGVGGARLGQLPTWVDGPAPARLRAPGVGGVIVLADVMWKDREGRAGLRFEFQDDEERDLWSGALIDALLAGHALS
jgi:hypothetical protein